MQSHVPHEALSRVGSYDAFGSNILVPIGLLAAGPLATVLSVQTVLFGAAVVTILLSLGSLLSTDVRSVQRPKSNFDKSIPSQTVHSSSYQQATTGEG
jgi:hypothetical protein